jgi:glutathione synthase/RimK-type ligase-like ATP-grasp enzyme
MASNKINVFKRKVANLFSSKFTKRIRARFDAFYRTPKVRSTLTRKLNCTDSLEVWQNSPHWQFQLNNKHNSHEFAKLYNCKVPELYWEGRDVQKIKFDLLPESYVIKPNLGYSSKMVFLMQGSRNLFDNKNYSQNEIIEELSNTVAKDPELEFMIEEFAINEKGDSVIPDDYKFYTFNGEIACIQVINRTGRSKGATSFYDENWNQIERVQKDYLDGPKQTAPVCLEQMIENAKKLSKAYKIFVRIDFYATNKGALFGEFTPTPFRGNGFTSFGNKLLLRYWDKYCKGMI